MEVSAVVFIFGWNRHFSLCCGVVGDSVRAAM